MKTWKRGEIRANFCPRCFTLLDAVANVTDEAMPKPGDFTACINCGEILTWTDDMELAPSKLADVPVAIRAKFARIVMLIKERRDGRMKRWGLNGG